VAKDHIVWLRRVIVMVGPETFLLEVRDPPGPGPHCHVAVCVPGDGLNDRHITRFWRVGIVGGIIPLGAGIGHSIESVLLKRRSILFGCVVLITVCDVDNTLFRETKR
jgi:hypothetical protein